MGAEAEGERVCVGGQSLEGPGMGRGTVSVGVGGEWMGGGGKSIGGGRQGGRVRGRVPLGVLGVTGKVGEEHQFPHQVACWGLSGTWECGWRTERESGEKVRR